MTDSVIIAALLIDAAWIVAHDHREDMRERRHAVTVLEELGIGACSECGGSGYDDPDIHDNLGKCPDCHGHGWVWRNND